MPVEFATGPEQDHILNWLYFCSPRPGKNEDKLGAGQIISHV